MKTVIRITLTRALSLLAFVLYTQISFSQALPDYRFENPRLISGNGGQPGAIYRFPSVKTGLDALVRIKTISGGATVENIDRTADGFPEAFQPEVKVSGRRNGYVDFQITFVRAGSTTDSLKQRELKASALDIDGDIRGTNVLYEYDEINMGGGTYDYNTLSTQLAVTPVGTAFRATNLTGVLFGAAVDTLALDIMYTVRNANVATFSWRAGVNNASGRDDATRYMSLYFKTFHYPNSVLSTPKVLDFKGNSDGSNAMLSWKLDVPAESYTGYTSTCELQRADESNTFTTIATFDNKTNQTNFSYTSQLLSTGRTLYRLKMTSGVNEVRYSNVLSFYKGNKAIKDLQVYPTVVSSNQFTINIPSERREQGAIRIINYAGQVVYEKQLELGAGANSISVRDFNPSLHGHYILVATAGSEQFRGKIIIQNGSQFSK
jgi:hypothetical protein